MGNVMLTNILSLVLLLVVTGFFAWLTLRLFRSRRPFLKWAGGLLSGLLTLLLVAGSAFALIGFFKLYLPASAPAPVLSVAGTPEQIARGEHLAAVLCTDCHTSDRQLPLIGGPDLAEEVPIPIGVLAAPNLTPGGPLQTWTDGEIYRAIRHGIGQNGQKLITMSSLGTRYFSDEDLQAVIAYLRSQPVVAHEPEVEQLNLLGLMILGGGLFPDLDSPQEPVVAPPRAPDGVYGEYVVRYNGCADCHGKDLSGGPGGLLPAGPNLRVIVPRYSEDQFIATLRTGVNPSGRSLDGEIMPWKSYARMDDLELRAMYAYLLGLKSEASQ